MAQVPEGQKLFEIFEISHTFPLTQSYTTIQSPLFELSSRGQIKRVKIVVNYSYDSNPQGHFPSSAKCVSEIGQTIKSKLVQTSVNVTDPSQRVGNVMDSHAVTVEPKGYGDTFTVRLEIYIPFESHESRPVETTCQIHNEKELNKLMVQQMDLADSTKINFTCDGESFQVNKLLLKARSPVFKRILDNPKSKEAEENKINFDDHGKDATEIFCNFLNSFEIAEGLLALHALDLFRLGEMYEIKPLSDFCVEPICKKIDVNSFVEIASLAYLHNNGKILSMAKKFFWSNTETIKNQEEWKEATTSQPNLALALLEAKGE